MIRVLVVDDEALVRMGFSHILNAADGGPRFLPAQQAVRLSASQVSSGVPAALDHTLALSVSSRDGSVHGLAGVGSTAEGEIRFADLHAQECEEVTGLPRHVGSHEPGVLGHGHGLTAAGQSLPVDSQLLLGRCDRRPVRHFSARADALSNETALITCTSSHLTPHQNLPKPAGQAAFAAGSRIATHST
ncbi:hypothetical protein ACFWPQ_46275 [Streptomyces sp. NPDC058464]|uniref:hypothetical protein n=1 Tax=Streptomyces sp. NPDC058464 TaxID=3346511 RepID=UPI00366478FC